MQSTRLLAAFALTPGPALAHGGDAPAGSWSPDMISLVLILAGAALYVRGLVRLWGRAGAGRGLSPARAAAFAAGLAVTAGLLVTPFEVLAGKALWAHMIQHCGLMLVAAPLLVAGRPGLASLWAFPPGGRARIGGLGGGPVGTAWRWLTAPFGAWLAYFAMLWLWHVPALHEAALGDDGLHALQHTGFVAASMLLWTALVDRPGAAAVVAVFATLAHSVALSALLTVSDRVWYPAYGGAWGVEGLADQQLAGLIMWVPGCLPLVGAAMWALLGVLRDVEVRARRAGS
jgi:putative membrane protein